MKRDKSVYACLHVCACVDTQEVSWLPICSGDFTQLIERIVIEHS